MNIGIKIKNGINILRERGVSILVNTALTKKAARKKEGYCYNLPAFAQIEITTYCNLRCSTCKEFEDEFGTGANYSRHMKFEGFKQILYKLPYLRWIRLNGVGEPLLNPDLLQMINYATKKGIDVSFFSNATVLKKDIARKLIESGLKLILFSIDGATPEVFEKIRKGAKFNDVIENINGFVKLAEGLKTGAPNIIVCTTLSTENIKELPGIVKLVSSLGIRNIIVKKMIPWVESLQDKIVCQEELMILKEARELAKESGININIGKRLEMRMDNGSQMESNFLACDWPWTSTYVSVDGWVTPCCNIFDPRRINFGNIFTEEFRTIWNKKEMKEFREELKGGLPKVCQISCMIK